MGVYALGYINYHFTSSHTPKAHFKLMLDVSYMYSPAEYLHSLSLSLCSLLKMKFMLPVLRTFLTLSHQWSISLTLSASWTHHKIKPIINLRQGLGPPLVPSQGRKGSNFPCVKSLFFAKRCILTKDFHVCVKSNVAMC